MKQLSKEQRAAVVRCLVEGCSIRSTVRITGVAKNTIQNSLAILGRRALSTRIVSCGNYAAPVSSAMKFGISVMPKIRICRTACAASLASASMWTWTAICAKSKLIVSWRLGARDAENANQFIGDVSQRLANRIQLTTDGFRVYLEAVEKHFGAAVDYAMLVKKYGNAGES